MTKSFSVLKNSAYNLIAWALPVVVNILAIPYIVKTLGYDEYGVWALVTAIIGYFAVMDMNLVQGGIRYLSEFHAKNDQEKVRQVISLGLLTYLGIGFIGMILISLSTGSFFLSFLKIPPSLVPLSRKVLYIAAVGFLVTMAQKYLASVPKALHRFDIGSKVEVFFNISLTAATVLLLYMGYGLLEIVLIRVVASFLNAMTFYYMIKKLIPYMSFTLIIPIVMAKQLASFSLYTFLSRIGTTSSNHFAKIIVSSVLGTTSLTLYSVPYLLVTRIMSISIRITTVFFPIASELGSMGERKRLYAMYLRMSRYICFMNTALVTVICLFSFDIMRLWMGYEFAQKTSYILVLIALATYIQTFSNLPSLLNDGLDHPKVTGYFALLRAVILIAAMIVGGKLYNLYGIAWAHFLSSLLFSLLFNLYVHKHTIGFPLKIVVRDAYAKTFLFAAGLSVVVLFSNVLMRPWNQHFFVIASKFILVSLALFFFGYFVILDQDIKEKISVGRLRKQNSV